MDDKTYIVNKNRIVKEFVKLVAFDSESYHETKIAAYLKTKLIDLGLSVYQDEKRNLYGYLKGTETSEPILFSSHMDTVSPGIRKRAVVHDDGTITSEGNTVLGADDVSGIVSILEALTVIKENSIKHPDIEVLFTTAEEPYCEGSRYVDYERIHSKCGYVLDLVGKVGTAAISAPSILSVQVHIKGKASHAGFAPEEGINALNIAVKALSSVKTGYVGDDTTVNFGVIHGGIGKNIVPEDIYLEGEIRSLRHENAWREVRKITESFEKAAKALGGVQEITTTEHIKAYRIDENDEVVRRFMKACDEADRCIKPDCIMTFGGSDANRLNEHGISTIVIACAMENCHSKSEYTCIQQLEQSAKLTLQLMILED